MDRGQDTNLLDTHNRLIANVVSHFRTLTMLATVQADSDEKQIDPQTIAVNGMSMQLEFEGLVRPISTQLGDSYSPRPRTRPSRTSSRSAAA